MKLLASLALTLAVAGSAQAAAPLSVSGAWSRPAVAGTNGVGYLVVANTGKAPDTLVRVESPLAAKVEMHSSSMAGGVMSMKKEDRVPVPAGGKATFGPGGYHLMLIGLTRTVKAGDQIPATLTFASGAKLKASFAVGMGPANPAMGPMRH
jgi:copper(I)-binding protein